MEGADPSIDGLDLDEGFAVEGDSCSSVDPTPRAFAFEKRGMFPKQDGGCVKPAEELVEIKPRQRAEDAQHHRSSMDSSAFDELPPAEVYDPSWNTNPLRCEAGQVGKGKGGDEKSSLLPTAFTLGSSADLDDEDDDDEQHVNDDIENVNSSTQNLSSPHSNKIYAMGRRGAMSFLSRKKNSVFVLFHSDEKAGQVSFNLKELLKSSFAGEILPNTKTVDVKAKAKVSGEDPLAPAVITQFVVSIESSEEPNRVKAVLRRSKADKQKSTPIALQLFCITLCAKYQEAHPRANLSKLLPDQLKEGT